MDATKSAYIERLSDLDDDSEESDAAERGTAIGAVVGTMAGFGLMLLPGVGSVLAAGPLVTAITAAGAGAAAGAATGGLIGALGNFGVSNDEAVVYAEAVRRGLSILVVRTDDEHADEVAKLMDEKQPIDLAERADMWREKGWDVAPTKSTSQQEKDETFGDDDSAQIIADYRVRTYDFATPKEEFDTSR